MFLLHVIKMEVFRYAIIKRYCWGLGYRPVEQQLSSMHTDQSSIPGTEKGRKKMGSDEHRKGEKKERVERGMKEKVKLGSVEERRISV